ncbi:MAG: penicillin-binding protein [Hamadaea sp.]|nr:penicillin-binding protein [Hamadaea sp.]
MSPENQAAPAEATAPIDGRRRGRRRGRRLLVWLAVLVVLLGSGTLVATVYYDSVEELYPESLERRQTTSVLAADGTTQLAQLGVENRISVSMDELPDKVRNALIAGEDEDFYESDGSVIARQYVRIATEQPQDSVGGKVRGWVLARKLEDRYDKKSILGMYLNTIDFGRGAHGVEKAAQAYFAKSARDLTVAEAAVLGAVIHAPYGDGGALSAYDPEAHPNTARERWAYVLDTMVEQGWLSQDERSQQQLPRVRPFATVTTEAQWGVKVAPGSPAGTATGNVVNHVYAELNALGIGPGELKTGGYRVVTTIDPQAQKLLEAAARPDLPGSQLHGRKIVKATNNRVTHDLEGAGVVIDHTTGAVLAYYGGLDGTALDLAGPNTTGDRPIGGYPAGGTMQIHSLAAALDAGASLQSRWRARPSKNEDGDSIGNNGVANTVCQDNCTLEHSFVKSYDVPFYWTSRVLGADKVVRVAAAAGVERMWDDRGVCVVLDEAIAGGRVERRVPFDYHVGYGRYPVTVLDNAAGLATFANRGAYNKPTFVKAIEKLDPATGKYTVVPMQRPGSKQVIKREVADDVTYAMRRVVADHGWSAAFNGRDVALKAGVWQGITVKDGKAVRSADNAHAWTLGFTKQFSVAIWTGNAAGSEPVTDPKTGRTISGATSLRIFQGFVTGYSAVKNLPREALPGPAHVGQDDFPLANGVA